MKNHLSLKTDLFSIEYCELQEKYVGLIRIQGLETYACLGDTFNEVLLETSTEIKKLIEKLI